MTTFHNPRPPWNFSWIIENELAAMAWPETRENLEYLANVGVKHLITLSPEKIPPVGNFSRMKWSKIDIEEFEAPTLDQIRLFTGTCKKCIADHEPVGVHCRMGRGRTGVMVACYLVHFHGLPPDRAIINVRLMRPGSIETREQERSVRGYHDYIRENPPGTEDD